MPVISLSYDFLNELPKLPRDVAIYLIFIKTHPEEHCKWQHKLYDFIIHVFKNETLFWDENQIEKYFSYQKYFPFNLFEWEKFCFVLHNCVFRKDGFPRFPDLFVLVGRGAGKNGYLSFEDFCLLTETHGIQNYNIDIYATSEDQAKTSFNEIYNVLENNQKIMRKFFYWNKEEITNLKTKSTIRYRTRNADTKDGGRPGKNDFDEKHAYQNWELIDVANTGLGKIEHPRTTSISTQGDVRDGPLDDDVRDAKDILRFKQPDNGTLVFMCMLDDEKEVHDESKWNKANPSLRYRPTLLETMRKEYQKYLKHPNTSRAFIVKRMNLIKEAVEQAVTSWDNILRANKPLIDLTGMPCIAGIDYALISDFVVAGLLFKKDDMIYWKSHAWFCSQSKDKARIKIDLKRAVDEGLLTIVDDIEINPSHVTDWLEEQAQYYDIKKVCLDKYRYSLFSKYLKKIGFNPLDRTRVKLVRPSDIMEIVPVIESWFNNGSIRWGDNFLMKWFTNNTKTVPVNKGNFEYDKIEPKSRKTDGFMAFVAAAICNGDLPEYCDYPDIDVIVI